MPLPAGKDTRKSTKMRPGNLWMNLKWKVDKVVNKMRTKKNDRSINADTLDAHRPLEP
jgi:hypothetical protein